MENLPLANVPPLVISAFLILWGIGLIISIIRDYRPRQIAHKRRSDPKQYHGKG